MQNKDIYFNFLEQLRRSGVTNMYGAAEYLTPDVEDEDCPVKRDFELLPHAEAVEVLKEWMKNYVELSKRLGWATTEEEISDMENYSKLFDESISRDDVDSFLKVLADENMLEELNEAEHIWKDGDFLFIVSFKNGSTKFFAQVDNSIDIYPTVNDYALAFGIDPVEEEKKVNELLGIEVKEEPIDSDESEDVFDYETGKLESEKPLDEEKKEKVIIKDDQPVKLQVVYEPYDRYASSGMHTAIIARDTYLQALKDMVDKMGLYIDSDEIEEENLTCEEIIESIERSNGDGCDFIYTLKDLLSGETIIGNDYDDQEEW